VQEVLIRSGVNFYRCFHCRLCHNGCPFAGVMEHPPNHLIRLLQLGRLEEALQSNTIWICVGCNACISFCPMAVNIPVLMDTLREMAREKGLPVKEPDVVEFHRQVLAAIRRRGRANELEIMLGYKLKKREWLNDLGLGLKMLAKQKIKLWPTSIRDPQELEPLFEGCEP